MPNTKTLVRSFLKLMRDAGIRPSKGPGAYVKSAFQAERTGIEASRKLALQEAERKYVKGVERDIISKATHSIKMQPPSDVVHPTPTRRRAIKMAMKLRTKRKPAMEKYIGYKTSPVRKPPTVRFKTPVGGTAISKALTGKKSFIPTPGGVPKPRMQLTSKQWQRLVERVALRETQAPTGVNPQGAYESFLPTGIKSAPGRKGGADIGLRPGEAGEAAFDMMSTQEPLVERLYSRLTIPQYRRGEYMGRSIEDRPYGEAMLRLAHLRRKLPLEEMKKIQNPVPPEVKILSTGATSEAKLPFGISYEKRQFTKLKRPKVEQAADVAELVRRDIERERRILSAKEARKKRLEAKRKAEAVEGVKETRDQTVQKLDIDKMTQQAYILDHMYRLFIKRKNTHAGRHWANLLKARGGTAKKLSIKDYFQRVGLRFFNDPEGAGKTFRREYKLLEKYWKEYQSLLKE